MGCVMMTRKFLWKLTVPAKWIIAAARCKFRCLAGRGGTGMGLQPPAGERGPGERCGDIWHVPLSDRLSATSIPVPRFMQTRSSVGRGLSGSSSSVNPWG